MAELNPVTSGGFSTYLKGCPPGPYEFIRGRNDQCYAFHFWSYHLGGAYFALADGSVTFITYSINDATIKALATRAGGETIII